MNRIEAAECYVKADKSDPFAAARVALHMRNGIAGFTTQGEDAFYSADPFQEERFLPNGTAYFVTVYRNVRRP